MNWKRLIFKKMKLENIDAEIKMMSNAENIKSILTEIYFQMEESENH